MVVIVLVTIAGGKCPKIQGSLEVSCILKQNFMLCITAPTRIGEIVSIHATCVTQITDGLEAQRLCYKGDSPNTMTPVCPHESAPPLRKRCNDREPLEDFEQKSNMIKSTIEVSVGI